MKATVRILGCFGLFLLSYTTQAQFKTWPVVNLFFKNQFDKQGFHHGRWHVKTAVPGTEGKQRAKGRYQHGVMIGEWKTYYPDKKLQQLEKCSFANDKNILETTRYYPNGIVEAKGTAAIERLANKSHFYRFGEWLYYQEDGTYLKTIYYDNGWPAKTTYANGRTERSIAPKSRIKVYGPGEATKPEKKAGTVILTKDKDDNTITTIYKENGDSTVTIKPPRKNIPNVP